MNASHRHRGRRGFSIIESTLAVLLVGSALVAALNVAAAASQTAASGSDRRYAEQLAHMLMAEVLAQPASGTNTTNGASGNRIATFNHLLDYDGFRESPPTTMHGEVCAPAGWEWQVNLTERAAETLDGRTLDLGLYAVRVRVNLPDGTSVRIWALRNRADSLDRAPTETTEDVLAVPLTVTMEDGTVRRLQPTIHANRLPAGTAVRAEVK